MKVSLAVLFLILGGCGDYPLTPEQRIAQQNAFLQSLNDAAAREREFDAQRYANQPAVSSHPTNCTVTNSMFGAQATCN